MCLIVKKGTRKIVIRKDRIVWKQVRASAYGRKSVTALYNDFKYKIGVTYAQELGIVYNKYTVAACDTAELVYLNRTFGGARILDLAEADAIDCYGEGFHFFDSFKRAAKSYNEDRGPFDVLRKFVIPAGSTIILSGNGVGITNRIIYSPE